VRPLRQGISRRACKYIPPVPPWSGS
jgi:hypothetical protein